MHSVHIIAAEPTVRVQYVNLHADFAKNSAAVGRRGGARLKAKPRKHYPVADTLFLQVQQRSPLNKLRSSRYPNSEGSMLETKFNG